MSEESSILAYLLGIPILSIISLIGIIVILGIHFAKKLKFKIHDYILILLFLIGIYLSIPYLLMFSANGDASNIDIPKMQTAAKLVLTPYEKNMHYRFISLAYENKHDGEKAIEYAEKAINGNYKKNEYTTYFLARLYSIKGDYDKAIELDKITPRNSLSTCGYVHVGDYKKALEVLDKERNVPSINFLKALYYRELGNDKEADRLYKLAEEQIRQNSEADYSDIENYKSIEAHKKECEKDLIFYKKLYHFE